MPKKSSIITFSITLTILLIGMVWFALKYSNPSQKIDTSILVRDSSHMTRTKNAKVQVVEFADYGSDDSAQAQATVGTILDEYRTNPEVNFVFRHYPTDANPNIAVAAEVAEAAGAQGKFWEMHQYLFAKRSEWMTTPDAKPLFLKYAQALNLDTTIFSQGLENKQFDGAITLDVRDGEKIGLDRLPTFFVNGERIETPGIPTPKDLEDKINAALAK